MSRALIVVDVQRDFCEGGALPVPGGNDVAIRLRHYLDSTPGYDHLLATRDWHVDPGRHFAPEPDFAGSWPRHCLADSAGAQLHTQLAGVAFTGIFSKGQYDHGYSGFDGTDHLGRPLSAYLRAFDVDAVDVVGLATDHCVGATALDAARLGWRTTVLTDLIAGIDQQASMAALRRVQDAGGSARSL